MSACIPARACGARMQRACERPGPPTPSPTSRTGWRLSCLLVAARPSVRSGGHAGREERFPAPPHRRLLHPPTPLRFPGWASCGAHHGYAGASTQVNENGRGCSATSCGGGNRPTAPPSRGCRPWRTGQEWPGAGQARRGGPPSSLCLYHPQVSRVGLLNSPARRPGAGVDIAVQAELHNASHLLGSIAHLSEH